MYYHKKETIPERMVSFYLLCKKAEAAYFLSVATAVRFSRMRARLPVRLRR